MLRALLICLLIPTVTVSPGDPFSTFNLGVYGAIKGILFRTAEKMPEENYNFKPTDSVRSFGQVVGHLADAQYMFCAIALGEKNPAPNIEGTKTSKGDLITALKGAFTYCDKVHSGMTDVSGAQMVKLFGNDTPKLSGLTGNSTHNIEHYGNLVTYLRLTNIVPPTSEPGFHP